MDTIKRILIFLFSLIGLFIFYIVIMVKLEVMAQQTEAKVQKMSADVTWEGFLYQKTVETVVQDRELNTENGQDNENAQ